MCLIKHRLCSGILEMGIALDCLGGRTRSFQTYESNVVFALRFMVDCGISGGNWVELRAWAIYATWH